MDTFSLLHCLRNLLIRTLLRAIRLFSHRIDDLLRRSCASPGLPVQNPTESYWQVPRAPVADYGSEEGAEMPEYADVVVIGSGITGTAFVRTLLDWERDNHKNAQDKTSVVMLEARGACSGATGRNGGHITPVLYAQFPSLVSAFGAKIAAQIIRFRLAHIPSLLRVAREEGLEENAQAREVDTWDVYLEEGLWGKQRRNYETYGKAIGEDGWRVVKGEEVIKASNVKHDGELGLREKTAGCLGTKAGAMHPYRLVTGILERLLNEYNSTFHLFTHTPCTSVSLSPVDNDGENTAEELYELTTPRGCIRTRHVIHATNGWVAHLLPGMRGKVIPARGVMTAQTPPAPTATAPWAGDRSFVFFPESGRHVYDYLTQQPTGGGEAKAGGEERYPRPQGEMMLGGAFAKADRFSDELGNADDSGWNVGTGRYLSGALGQYFTGVDEGVERVKSLWSGVLGVSVDGQPWVGRIPEKVAGRRAPRARRGHRGANHEATGLLEGEARSNLEGEAVKESGMLRGGLASPGEWMAAGYSGEGMVHAWLSGTALAYMVLGLDHCQGPEAEIQERENGGVDAGDGLGNLEDLERWFPSVYRVTEKRWSSAGIENLFAEFVTG
ncbi:hypothetical protein C0991_010750 [Blastosporella zonata]|nr:hypothetical protein C0991_010750 [Blastosporella zonata]